MERILSDFRRSRSGMLLWCVIITVVICAAAWLPLLFSGSWTEWVVWAWAIVAAAMSLTCVVLLIKAFIEILATAPRKLKSQLLALPEEERSEILREYPAAKTLGERWFMPAHILFYTNRRALVLRYDAIKTVVQKKNGDLLLATSSGDITMPVKAGENAGIIFAVLRSRNPEIKAGGKETERT